MTSEFRLRHFLTLRAARLTIPSKTHILWDYLLKIRNLRDLYVNELHDLHSAESQLTTAIPKMAEAATSSQLKNALNNSPGRDSRARPQIGANF